MLTSPGVTPVNIPDPVSYFGRRVGQLTGSSIVYVCVFIGNILVFFKLLNVGVVQCIVLFISQKTV